MGTHLGGKPHKHVEGVYAVDGMSGCYFFQFNASTYNHGRETCQRCLCEKSRKQAAQKQQLLLLNLQRPPNQTEPGGMPLVEHGARHSGCCGRVAKYRRVRGF